jgi:N4-gp56 family major capsid protein
VPAQTYAGLSNEQRSNYEKILLPRLLAKLVMFKDAQKGSIPAHSGTTTEWRAFASLPLATTPLTEGSPPSDSALSISKVTATVAQYGAWVKASDLLVHQGVDPVWAQIYDLLGENAGSTLHTKLVSVLAAGTTVRYVTQTSRTAITAANVMTVNDIRKAVRTLAAANVDRFPDGMYHALIHPNVAYDVMSDTSWKNPGEYNGGTFGGNSIVTGELDGVYGAKFMISTDAPVFAGEGASGVDVYGTLIYGPGWYGVRDLDANPVATPNADTQKGISVMAVPVGEATKDDPLAQFGVAGWKAEGFVTKVLQELRGVRVESAVTA